MEQLHKHNDISFPFAFILSTNHNIGLCIDIYYRDNGYYNKEEAVFGAELC